MAAAVAVGMFGGLLIGAPRAEAADEATATIQFLNPSTGSSLKISDKQAKDQTFALTAWVSNSAAVKLVEFEISSLNLPLSRATTIGAATAVAPDTYELQWAVSSTLTDGRYSLRAIAYGQSGEDYFEIDTDEETSGPSLHFQPPAITKKERPPFPGADALAEQVPRRSSAGRLSSR